MSVYVDSAENRLGRMVMCHMVADTPAELHTMALKIGLKYEWYQSPKKSSFPHYDLSLSRRVLAVKNGAKEISRRELGEFMKRYKASAGKNTWLSLGWLERAS